MIRELLEKAEQQLYDVGCETPRLDAEVLLAYVLGCERHEIYTATTRYLVPGGKLEVFKSYIERRLKREPVAYIVGYKEFWSIKIKVTPAVLIPRPETEEVVEKALKILDQGLWIKDHGPEILDLCTGSGCIAAALAKEIPNAKIVVTDISEDALEVARQNLAFANGRIQFIKSDLFENVKGQFDLIVSNPPYIPTQAIQKLEPEITQFEPKLALDGGSDGLDFVRRIRQDAPKFLKTGGQLILENGPEIEIWKN
ncbi:MAG: protein-(glutamine-N5) methyltransferase, release factor-specific [Deltaproteobacteria bacterium RIFCSPLOWO2_01_44_7]|nr:MAG: protein-(glutamine-N5) methyltransferase, release factor-specific [Deltaproteobacteria bacterium RIFCSPHIGHO2_01_FULL_43_49]OGQ14468.1 MAG: protein-(glutamine-N5) methyltransferase, release factor-specific [Deltaproteobacteria bacterium RIFCSPHIGHO2_02_FULL_44_53]OGQ27849.1 MAG: protein-(glutamine-N5) methyltransferase, release factor-specific [Deltaproteobacteria bacterium RIFCSPHIGHO2_12_FULL_44_21]OGQ30925.1 MAG: protein-(glutamine-N5) methyltransferase, release factor-specific [Delta